MLADCLDRNFMGSQATDIASFRANVDIVLSIESIVVVSTANTTDITFTAGKAFAIAIKGSSDMLVSDFNSEGLDFEHSVCQLKFEVITSSIQSQGYMGEIACKQEEFMELRA